MVQRKCEECAGCGQCDTAGAYLKAVRAMPPLHLSPVAPMVEVDNAVRGCNECVAGCLACFVGEIYARRNL